MLTSFDFANGPITRGYFVGDQHGLDALAGGVLRGHRQRARIGQRPLDSPQSLTPPQARAGPLNRPRTRRLWLGLRPSKDALPTYPPLHDRLWVNSGSNVRLAGDSGP